MTKILVLLLVGSCAIFVVVVAVAFFFQRRLQYFPTHQDRRGEGVGVWEPLKDPQGQFLGYWRPCDRPKHTLLFFHGNGGEALHRSWIEKIVSADTSVVLVEYPGYGARPGVADEAGFFAAAVGAYDEAVRRWGVPVRLLGESMGSAVAVYLATQRPVSGLALISPISSGVEVGKKHYPWLPVGLLMRDRYDSLSRVGSLQVPMKLIHGTMDEVVPFALAQRLFAAYGGQDKELIEIPGFGHNNMVDAVIDSPFADSFRSFLNS